MFWVVLLIFCVALTTLWLREVSADRKPVPWANTSSSTYCSSSMQYRCSASAWRARSAASSCEIVVMNCINAGSKPKAEAIVFAVYVGNSFSTSWAHNYFNLFITCTFIRLSPHLRRQSANLFVKLIKSSIEISETIKFAFRVGVNCKQPFISYSNELCKLSLLSVLSLLCLLCDVFSILAPFTRNVMLSDFSFRSPFLFFIAFASDFLRRMRLKKFMLWTLFSLYFPFFNADVKTIFIHNNIDRK